MITMKKFKELAYHDDGKINPCHYCGFSNTELKQFIIASIKELNQGNYNDLSWNDNQDVHISEAFVLSNWLKYTFDITDEDLEGEQPLEIMFSNLKLIYDDVRINFNQPQVTSCLVPLIDAKGKTHEILIKKGDYNPKG
jgi:hypothetical protein